MSVLSFGADSNSDPTQGAPFLFGAGAAATVLRRSASPGARRLSTANEKRLGKTRERK
jgi:hypothetical protein